jgi:hypothetical protein
LIARLIAGTSRRLRENFICIAQDVGVKRTGLLLLLAVACGPKAGPNGGGGGGGGAGGPMPAAVSVYAGLRWVPADATYVVAARRSEDAVVLLKSAVDALGIVAEFDASELSRDSERELGFDVLSPEAYAEMGVDLERGIAVWSRGLGPSFAVPLADPQRTAAEIERRRGPGTVVQVSRAHDSDVFTVRPANDAAIHWTITGDWFLAHLEYSDEHEAEGAWFEEAWAARGGVAGHADFTAAVDEGKKRLGVDPPVVGLVRTPQLVGNRLLAEGPGQPECASTVGAINRIFLSAGVAGPDSRGAIVVEVPAGLDGLRALMTKVPAGWADARKGAPLQLEVGIDVRAIARAFSPCADEDLAGNMDSEAPSSGRLFVHEIDIDDMKGKGAAAVELSDPGLVARALDDVPGISLMRKRRKVAGAEVTDVNVPMLPRFSYAQVGATTVVSVSSAIDALLAFGPAGDEVARFEILPRAWPVETWDALLREVVGREDARADTIRRLRAWSRGFVSASVEGRAVVLFAHGTR